MPIEHPAKFSDEVLEKLREVVPQYMPRGGTLLDPFAGVGRIHELALPRLRTMGVELEPEWAHQHPDTIVGNALHLTYRAGSVTAIGTSPSYGTRMADHHVARDTSKWYTYRHCLGRELSPESSAVMQWGPKYRAFHWQAWAEATRVARKFFFLNISDHWREGGMQAVSAWHVQVLVALGWEWVNAYPIRTRRNGNGANRDLRMENEWLFVFKRRL